MRNPTATRSREGRAAYRMLARELRAAILRDDYANGVRLPTEAELAQRYGVSRQTVRRAFHDLVSEGMVTRVPGRGTFAAPRSGEYLRQFGSIEDLMGLSLDTTLELITPLHREVHLDAAGRLRLSADAVHTVVFRRLHDGVPFCVTSVFLPPRVGELLADAAELVDPGTASSATVIGLLDARLKEPIAEAEQSITAARSTPELAATLDCAVGGPLLRIDRLYFDTKAEPVELATSYFVPEHYSYRVRLRRSVR